VPGHSGQPEDSTPQPPRGIPPPPGQTPHGIPPPPGQGAPADAQPGGLPQPVPPPPPNSQSQAYSWTFYERLAILRDSARKHAAQGTVLTNISAAVTAGTSILGLLMSGFSILAIAIALLDTGATATQSQAQAQAAGSSPPPLGILILMFAMIGLSILVTTAAAVYGIYVLSTCNGLYRKRYAEAMQQLREGSLAQMVAREEFWGLVQDRITERSWIKFVGRSAYRSLEEHLDYCACHLPALTQIAAGERRLNIWQLRREEAVFKWRRWFMQKQATYWACGCLALLFFRVGFVVVFLYTVLGGRFISSRAALVAICDFMLERGESS
jgi:hypothetical protein